MKLSILLVDDEPSIRLTVGDALRGSGHHVTVASDGGEAADLLESKAFDVVITDIRLPKVDGLAILRRVLESTPECDVILITAFGDIGDAVTALKSGARDYLTKPFDNDEIIVRVQRLAERRALARELDQARASLAEQELESLIIGQSPCMVRLQKRIETMADSDASVIITGESGTGKELVARTLHALSRRREGPFVPVNCAAFPETLLEAELFGHERGAFTGAMRKRQGRFKAANDGTLFLDEIAEIPPMAQVKLLRVLQEGSFEAVGSDTPVVVDVRIISATHRNLKQRIQEGLFREDLYYRLNVLEIPVPPLRDRRGDLPLLVEHFLRRYLAKDVNPPTISPRAWAVLSGYSFPGNVRELEHAIQHALVLAGGDEIDVEHLPEDLIGTTHVNGEGDPGGFRPIAVASREFEREYLLRALNLAHGKKMKAAELLGISRKNLWEKLRLHHVTDSDIDDE
jgi:DNA-binding NtrC family response regulator